MNIRRIPSKNQPALYFMIYVIFFVVFLVLGGKSWMSGKFYGDSTIDGLVLILIILGVGLLISLLVSGRRY